MRAGPACTCIRVQAYTRPSVWGHAPRTGGQPPRRGGGQNARPFLCINVPEHADGRRRRTCRSPSACTEKWVRDRVKTPRAYTHALGMPSATAENARAGYKKGHVALHRRDHEAAQRDGRAPEAAGRAPFQKKSRSPPPANGLEDAVSMWNGFFFPEGAPSPEAPPDATARRGPTHRRSPSACPEISFLKNDAPKSGPRIRPTLRPVPPRRRRRRRRSATRGSPHPFFF